jgi:hypothetical protein
MCTSAKMSRAAFAGYDRTSSGISWVVLRRREAEAEAGCGLIWTRLDKFEPPQAVPELVNDRIKPQYE